ncbi:hypothetical protein SARC_16088, partial [Sphaeroforma arctica JP610]
MGEADTETQSLYDALHSRLSETITRLEGVQAALDEKTCNVEGLEGEICRLNDIIRTSGMTLGAVAGDSTTKKIGVSSVVYNFML